MLSATISDPMINNATKSFVLIGKTGAGKSAAGNTIFGQKHFESRMRSSSLTMTCQKVIGMVGQRRIAVIDTPGFCDTSMSEAQTKIEISRCIYQSAPGPHVFVVVLKLGRYTEEEKKTVEMIQDIFGKDAAKYIMILFTHGDQLDDGETVEDFFQDDEDLKSLVDKCDKRYHVFRNKSEDRSQVTELLDKIDRMVATNGGSHYTTELFQKAARELQEKEERLLKANEQERNKEIEALMKKCHDLVGSKLDEKIDELKRMHRESARTKAEEETFKGVGVAGNFGPIGFSIKVGTYS